MRLCDNTCPAFFTNDGVCDDGGEGSRWNNCGQLGTDCADCGERSLGGPDIIDAGEPVEYTHNTTLQVAAAVASHPASRHRATSMTTEPETRTASRRCWE